MDSAFLISLKRLKFRNHFNVFFHIFITNIFEGFCVDDVLNLKSESIQRGLWKVIEL